MHPHTDTHPFVHLLGAKLPVLDRLVQVCRGGSGCPKCKYGKPLADGRWKVMGCTEKGSSNLRDLHGVVGRRSAGDINVRSFELESKVWWCVVRSLSFRSLLVDLFRL